MRSYHTLEELLTRFVTSEIVQDVLCDGCGMHCLSTKTLTLGKLPKCLCLHISRTTWSNSGTPIKRDDPVKFPQILTLDPYTFTETKKRNARVGCIYFTLSNDFLRFTYIQKGIHVI